MNKFLVVLNAFNGILFVAIGLLWVISPYEAGANFGILDISEGLGRSSLIGDVGSYFFCIGLMMILAAYTLRSIWFYAPAMLLAVTALFRVISWAAHDATFATQFIIIEILLIILLLVTSKRMSSQ
ncbi:MAG: hypothetical protein CMK44_08470 [Porticoccus sp.]|nr:hypothetical protein [Porticoccus sp.]|tara:strand:+ start:496 stop:873 length:378 start_codon:yes stop_codon:yes gene_type:complete